MAKKSTAPKIATAKRATTAPTKLGARDVLDREARDGARELRRGDLADSNYPPPPAHFYNAAAFVKDPKHDLDHGHAWVWGARAVNPCAVDCKDCRAAQQRERDCVACRTALVDAAISHAQDLIGQRHDELEAEHRSVVSRVDALRREIEELVRLDRIQDAGAQLVHDLLAEVRRPLRDLNPTASSLIGTKGGRRKSLEPIAILVISDALKRASLPEHPATRVEAVRLLYQNKLGHDPKARTDEAGRKVRAMREQ